jgi:Sec-independent protein secretion pathway component TatC
VLSQFSMAVPMYLLYEGGILFASILRRNSTAVEVREEEESA